jgi:hypothetical protein
MFDELNALEILIIVSAIIVGFILVRAIMPGEDVHEDETHHREPPS